MSVQRWCDDRVPTDLLHLDVAASGRVSEAVVDAQVAHLRREAVEGAYVAQAAAAEQVDEGRAAVASMVRLAGRDVYFAESALAAMAALLSVWPLPHGGRVGTLSGEYGGYAAVLRATAELRGWELVDVPTDQLGRVTDVPDRLDLLVVDHVASQRGVVQPDLTGAGVPVLLDCAQALGQTDVPTGAAAYLGTSRKWLCGPRGVGFGIVAPEWQERLDRSSLPLEVSALDWPGWRDAQEAHVAGRVGFAQAVRTWSPAILPVLQSAAAAARVLLEGAGGWRVVEPVEEPTGTTTLVPPPGVEPAAVRAALIEQGVLVSAVSRDRSRDLAGPVLRVSTAAWVTPPDLERLAGALTRCTEEVGSGA